MTYLYRASGWGPSRCGSSCCGTRSWWHHCWWCGCWWDMADTPHRPALAWRNLTGMLEDRKTVVEWWKKWSLLFDSSHLPRAQAWEGNYGPWEWSWTILRRGQANTAFCLNWITGPPLLPPDTLRVLHFLWFAHGCHLFQGELRPREKGNEKVEKLIINHYCYRVWGLPA